MLQKMSGEAYVDMLDKLANEVIEEGLSNEEPVTDEDAENMAKHAVAFYEQAQMAKEAAEADFIQASAYEDAARIILDNLVDGEY